jgi:transposase-like protein
LTGRVRSEASDGARRRRATRAERSAWVLRWERSGQSAREFASEHGLRASTLTRWKRRGRDLASSAAGSPGLREVSLGGALAGPVWVAEVRRPDGVTVRLSAEAPRGWIRALLGRRVC